MITSIFENLFQPISSAEFADRNAEAFKDLDNVRIARERWLEAHKAKHPDADAAFVKLKDAYNLFRRKHGDQLSIEMLYVCLSNHDSGPATGDDRIFFNQYLEWLHNDQ